MAKTPAKHRQPWTPADNKQLKELIRENTPTRVMGISSSSGRRHRYSSTPTTSA